MKHHNDNTLKNTTPNLKHAPSSSSSHSTRTHPQTHPACQVFFEGCCRPPSGTSEPIYSLNAASLPFHIRAELSLANVVRPTQSIQFRTEAGLGKAMAGTEGMRAALGACCWEMVRQYCPGLS
eukprot:3937090-Rhodomonas_salina.1